MRHIYFVKVDFNRLRSNPPADLSSPEAEAQSNNEDLADWLIARGFRIANGGWYADGRTLAQIEPAAVLSKEQIR